MFSKKEKKALASIFMLLIGWPIGLDQFFEGKNYKGISTTIGWSVTALLFLYGFVLKSYYTGLVVIIAVVLTLAGSFQVCKKLIKVTRAFVDAKN
tara:strand:+ start:208 stop:492 length:285 start_codon:yes stop_codon:yes gene_type:complete